MLNVLSIIFQDVAGGRWTCVGFLVLRDHVCICMYGCCVDVSVLILFAQLLMLPLRMSVIQALLFNGL